MKLQIDDKEYDVNHNNSAYLVYPNDIANGLFVDLDDDYMFVSERVKGNDVLIGSIIVAEEIELIYSDKFDITRTPDMWVARSLGRIITSSLEMMLEDL